MSDLPIQPGDLVAVVHGCCEKARACALGVHATVLRFYNDPGWLCQFCDKPIPALRAELDHGKWNSPVAWLKRVPPLTESEEATRKEGVST